MANPIKDLAPPFGADSWERGVCKSCDSGTTAFYYCRRCFSPVNIPEGLRVPRVQLPCQVDIILRDGPRKATGPQAKALAPDYVSVRRFPEELPERYDPQSTYVLFPSEDAKPVSALRKLGKPFRLLVIDSQWQKTNGVLMHETVTGLPRVKLSNPPASSAFWRFHDKGEGCLCSIEALYFAMSELMEYPIDTSDGGLYSAEKISDLRPHMVRDSQSSYEGEDNVSPDGLNKGVESKAGTSIGSSSACGSDQSEGNASTALESDSQRYESSNPRDLLYFFLLQRHTVSRVYNGVKAIETDEFHYNKRRQDGASDAAQIATVYKRKIYPNPLLDEGKEARRKFLYDQSQETSRLAKDMKTSPA